MNIQLANFKVMNQTYTIHGTARILSKVFPDICTETVSVDEAHELARGNSIKLKKAKLKYFTYITDTIYKGKFMVEITLFKEDLPSYLKNPVERLKFIIW